MDTRAVLFDLDGTLVDSLPGIEFSVDCSLAECNMPPRDRELRPLIGPPIRSIFSEVVPEADEEQLSRLECAFRSSYDSSGWRKTLLRAGTVETLTKLKAAGLPLFLITNKPIGPTRRMLEEFSLSDLFTDVLCRDSRYPSFRSKAEMLQQITAAHKLEPGACLYAGDTPEDYRAAVEAGIPVAIVAHGYGEPGVLYPAAISVDSLTELLTLVEVMEMSS